MYNMILEDEEDLGLNQVFDRDILYRHMQREFTFHDLEARIREVEDINAYFALQNDLIDHLWLKKGHSM